MSRGDESGNVKRPFREDCEARMNIRVKPETEAWLKAEVAQGRFGSIEEAIETIILEHQVSVIDVATDDHLWAKPFIEEALAALERGESSPLEDVAKRVKERIAAGR